MKVYTLMTAAAMATLLAGCATGPSAEQRAKIEAAERGYDADRMVQNRIAESTASIAATLQLIERIERGAPPPRAGGRGFPGFVTPGQQGGGSAMFPNAPGSMIQGNLMSGSPSQRTAVASSAPPGPTGYADDVLNTRLRIQWKNGSPEELLRTLAQQMNVPFKAMGAKRQLPVVSVTSENESMGSILASVARQIDRDADIAFNKSQQPAVLELRFK